MLGMGSIQSNLPEKAIIIDVRSEGEYKGGHAKSSVNIPLNLIENNIQKIKDYKQPIITVCASGMRSGVAANLLKKHNIEAYNGGSWKSNIR